MKKYGRINFLVSYAYLRNEPFFSDLIQNISPYINTMLDSGAHTNYRIILDAKASGKEKGKEKAKPVELSDYIKYLLSVPDNTYWQYISLDVIRNKNETDFNLQEMLNAGLRPMPVYIEGYTVDDLHKIMQINNARICVAGAGKGSIDNYIRTRYKKVYEFSNQQAKIHGLGYGRWPGIFHATLASSDSSSFNYGARYGNLSYYDKTKGILGLNWKQLAQTPPDIIGNRVKKTNPQKRAEFISYLSHVYRLSDVELSDKKLYRGEDSMTRLPLMSGVFTYLDFMEHVRNTGKDYFIALPNLEFFLLLIACAVSKNYEDFSYSLVKDTYHRFSDRKNDDKKIEIIVNEIKEHTQWEIQSHSL